MLQRCGDLGLLVRIPGSRAVKLTARGRDFLHMRLGIDLAA
jgi:hypothetical protein